MSEKTKLAIDDGTGKKVGATVYFKASCLTHGTTSMEVKEPGGESASSMGASGQPASKRQHRKIYDLYCKKCDKEFALDLRLGRSASTKERGGAEGGRP